MIKIGLTGNMGSGKTTIARIFHALKVPIFYADIEAKKLMEQESIIQQLNSFFGETIFDNNGKIDKKQLASIVFKDNAALEYLNKLIHPEVAKEYERWLQKHTYAQYIIHEAAILFESGFDKYMDTVIYVYAPETLRIERIIKRDNLSAEEIVQRFKNQWEDEKKISLSKHIIENNDTDLLIPQVLKIHKLYQSTIL